MSKSSTQEFLIDHLLRIVQGVLREDPDENGIVKWVFGFGEEALTTYQPSSLEDQKEWNEQGREWKKDAQLELDSLLVAIEAGDHMGIPKRLAKLRRKREFGSIPLDEVVAMGEAWAKLEMLETKEAVYAIAYAYEALNKLKDMVDRGQQAVQEKHLLPNVPPPVDRYMSEAASCYRYGFDLACVSLCRSALEEALKDSLGEKVESLRREQLKECELKQLIKSATDWNILDREHSHMADKIRKSGNSVVHGDFKAKDVRHIAKETLFNSRLIIQSIWS